MSGVDFTARSLAAQVAVAATRSRIVERLARSIARAGGVLPPLMAAGDRPTIGAPVASDASTIASAHSWSLPTQSGRFTFLRGSWGPEGGNPYIWANKATTYTGSGATDGGTTPLIRFWSDAPVLEIGTEMANSFDRGYRLRVDGAYAHAGQIGIDVPSTYPHLQPITWGDGSAAYRKPRLYEMEGGGNLSLFAVTTPPTSTVWPAPAAETLRAIVHGDSFVYGSSANQDYATALYPPLAGIIPLLLGLPDTAGSGVGGSGYVATNGGSNLTFIQRIQPDVIAHAPDIVIELGGINDEGPIAGDAAAMQAVVAAWLGALVAALPDVLVFMTGPMCPSDSISTARLALRDGKRAAAAMFPDNVVFIDNVAAAWVTGVGNANVPTGTGNADWVTSGDTTHPTSTGHEYLARRIVGAIAAGLPTP